MRLVDYPSIPAAMKLAPISPSRPLRLTDADARPPKGLPHGDELKEALATEVDRLRALQSVFYADGRHALLVAGKHHASLAKLFEPLGGLFDQARHVKPPAD